MQKQLGRKRVLLVNCYLDHTRMAVRRTHKIPKAMGPVFLAGACSPELCDVRVYNEQYSGPLEDEQLLAWPDMLVLTGLTTALDRMRQVTAYARTKNSKVIVVAGGHAIRSLPRYSRRFFDYCCQGDVEQLGEVLAEAFGPAYAAEEVHPRFDLAYWLGRIGHVESSRYCNFRCSFCTLTAEGRKYQTYDLEHVRRQILGVGKREFLLFIDNNFYGTDRNYLRNRFELLKEMWRAGQFSGWSALVTSDFFYDDENLRLARESGCIALFSGVESFDVEWLAKFNKHQNTRIPQVEIIRKTLDAGILFIYGLVFDVTTRRIADFRRELEFILGHSEITLPGFVSATIPLLGTPFFYDCLKKGLILPGTRVRDLDDTTLTLRGLDPLEETAEFLRGMQTLRGYQRLVLRHSLDFVRRYRSVLSSRMITAALVSAAPLCLPALATAPGSWKQRRKRRTYISSTDVLDDVYQPAFRVASRYENHFEPTMLTDREGRLAEDLADDLVSPRKALPEDTGSPLVHLTADLAAR